MTMTMTASQPIAEAFAPRPSPSRPKGAGARRGEAGRRLRAATALSPPHGPPPTSMALRATRAAAGARGGVGGASLAAFAGPTGIAVVDVAAPQRPCLRLDYSSSTEEGIAAMAFQPCADDPDPDRARRPRPPGATRYGGGSSSSPILLATARHTGILIWDCSGRALSPLIGRLNASDSRGGGASGSAGGGTRPGVLDDPDAVDGRPSAESEDSGPHTKAILGSAGAAAMNQDVAPKKIGAPLSLERNISAMSASTASSCVTANIAPSNHRNSANAAVSSAASTQPHGNSVTSLDWKRSAPILLATCGASACVWDLRASLLSGGAGRGATTGARPTARFAAPEESDGAPPAPLVHCAWAADEASRAFATLDAAGVVRVWDEHRADRPRRAFRACPGGGVGVASLPSSRGAEAGGAPRWVTWGLDPSDPDKIGDGEFVVKVWTESAREKHSVAAIAEAADASDGQDDGGEIGGGAIPSYRATSRISAPGAVAARVHPTFPDGILLFRDKPAKGEGQNRRPPGSGGVAAGNIDEEGGGVEGLANSPAASPQEMFHAAADLHMRASPQERAVARTPPSPPPLLLDEAAAGHEPRDPWETSTTATVRDGWEAELWRVDAVDDPVPSGATAGREKQDIDDDGDGDPNAPVGARRVATFCGGGAEEDALMFAPGSVGDGSDVIAVDLTLGATATDRHSNGHSTSTEKGIELSLCVLTEAGRLTVYGVPEASELQETATKATEPHTEQGRAVDTAGDPAAYRNQQTINMSAEVGGNGGGAGASPWFNKNVEEEDLFGEQTTLTQDSPKKPPAVIQALVSSTNPMASPQFDMEEITAADSKTANSSLILDANLTTSISEGEVDTGTPGDVQNNNLPIDPAVAARVICPPLCGVAFSGVGTLVAFSNGPVKQMWSYYQSNEALSSSNGNLLSNPGGFPFCPKNKGNDVLLELEEEDTSIHNQDSTVENQKLPRSLADLIEMNLRSQTLQWGDNEQPENSQGHRSSSSSSSSSDSSSSYEDGDSLALASDDSDVSDDSRGFCNSPPRGNINSMLDNYFSPSHEPLTEIKRARSGGSNEFAGLPSLSPHVVITRKYDDLLLSQQTPKLANMLNLGDTWWLTEDFEVPVSSCPGEMNYDSARPNKGSAEFLRKFAERKLERSLSFTSSFKSSQHASRMVGLFAHQLPTSMTPPDRCLCKYLFVS